MRCGLELAKTIIALHLIFAVTCAVWCIKCGLKLIYFSGFELFPPSKKLIFLFVLGQVLKYWASFFFFFGLAFLINTYKGYYYYYFFFLKTRVIKLFFFFWRSIKLWINNIFNIKKINILIYRKGVVRFSYYKIANCTVQCIVTYGAVRLFHFAGNFGAVWWTPLVATKYSGQILF